MTSDTRQAFERGFAKGYELSLDVLERAVERHPDNRELATVLSVIRIMERTPAPPDVETTMVSAT